MAYQYEVGCVRWRRHNPAHGDVRSARRRKGWYLMADLIDRHPITGRPLKFSQWWIREEYLGDGK